jgi:beta-lactam-binding protein with PASTA domain
MLLGIGVVALVALGIAVAYLLTHHSCAPTTTVVVQSSAPSATGTASVSVPTVVGRSFSSARSLLEDQGFKVERAPMTSNKPAGTVLRELPQAGAQVAKGSVVTLGVSAGSTPATTAATSTAATTTAETTTSQATTTTTTAPPPTPANATMPDVKSQTEQAAVTALSRANILPSLVFVPASDSLGTIVQQAKPGGTTVPYHAHVQLNVSRGPGDKPDETVPNVVGKSIPEAVAALNAGNLRLIYVRLPVTSRTQVGKVVQQSPLGGGRAPRNAQVLVFLGVLRS